MPSPGLVTLFVGSPGKGISRKLQSMHEKRYRLAIEKLNVGSLIRNGLHVQSLGSRQLAA